MLFKCFVIARFVTCTRRNNKFICGLDCTLGIFIRLWITSPTGTKFDEKY